MCDAVGDAVSTGVVALKDGWELLKRIAQCTQNAVEATICAANVLAAVPGGSEARDLINSQLSELAMNLAIAAGGSCQGAAGGLIVCIVPIGAEVPLRGRTAIPTGVDQYGNPTYSTVDFDFSFTVWGKGGTTIGNVFITENQAAMNDAALLDHELVHTYQWAAAGGLPFALLYGLEYARAGECNRFEEAAGYAAGGYLDCI